MAGKLTTLYLYKTFAGITLSNVSQDTLYNRLISEVSDVVAVALDRTLEATTYRVWLDGTGTADMLLPEWPVTALYKVAPGFDNVLKVQYTGNGLHADLSVDATNVTLHYLDNSGVEQTTEIALASYPTVTLLAAAIDAVAGWTGTAESTFGETATLLLRPVSGWNVLTPAFQYLQAPRQDGIDVRLSSETNRGVERVGGGTFPEGRSNIFVWYKAGYTLPVDNVSHSQLQTAGNLPDGLILAVNQTLKDTLDGIAADGSLRSESIGDYSYTRAEITSAVKNRWTDLARYARVSL